MASVKKLHVTLNLAPDLPEHAVGDAKRLMQIILNVVGNAVKFSKDGSISITAFVAKAEFLRDAKTPEFFPVPSDIHFYLRVQVWFLDCLCSFYFGWNFCLLEPVDCFHAAHFLDCLTIFLVF